MQKIEFIRQFADVLEYDETKLNLDVIFRDLDEWNSLTSTALQIMVSSDLNSSISSEELQGAKTIKDIYEIILKNKQ